MVCMKPVNLLSVIQSFLYMERSLFQKFMNHYGIDILKGIRDYELEGIKKLLEELLKHKDISITDGYYLGYSIPQIGKEFDLLRFGDNNIINIEIKSESTLDKINKQQIRNRYYLSFLNKELHIYTYISNEHKLYKLIIGATDSTTQEVQVSELFDRLAEQLVVTYTNIDEIFNPSDYLVSPFNSTDKFINGSYFLTVQQECIFNDIQKTFDNSNKNFIAITGDAGTGKTLLTYHIARVLQQRRIRVLILHCAQLNNGHNKLNENWGWNICMPKYSPAFNDFDVIIIDEAQRLYPSQFKKIVESVRQLNKSCIFSYDEKQYLHDNEKNYNIKDKIEIELGCSPFRLKDKIRTNKEISYFIKQIFNQNRNIPDIKFPNVDFIYCKEYKSAKLLLNMMCKKGWKVPNYTPGTRSFFKYEEYLSEDHDCAHSVIGQEFENVVIVLDESFKYNSTGELIANNRYYSQKQMLYQIVTRAIKKLYVVIINNEVMLNRCIQILQ